MRYTVVRSRTSQNRKFEDSFSRIFPPGRLPDIECEMRYGPWATVGPQICFPNLPAGPNLQFQNLTAAKPRIRIRAFCSLRVISDIPAWGTFGRAPGKRAVYPIRASRHMQKESVARGSHCQPATGFRSGRPGDALRHGSVRTPG